MEILRITYEMLITLNFHLLKKMLKAPSMMCVWKHAYYWLAMKIQVF